MRERAFDCSVRCTTIKGMRTMNRQTEALDRSEIRHRFWRSMPVSMNGTTTRHVTVSPGDFILADEGGAIVIPPKLILDVLAKAEELTRTEMKVREELPKDLSLNEAPLCYGHA